MEQTDAAAWAERIAYQSQREMQLAITSIMRANDLQVLTRKSAGIETQLVKVCPRLYYKGEGVQSEEEADLVICNDFTIKVGAREYVLPAEYVLVVSELLNASKSHSVVKLSEMLDPMSHGDIRQILGHFIDLWGDEVLCVEYDAQNRPFYRFNENLAIFDSRLGGTVAPSPLSEKAAPVVPPPPKLKASPPRAPITPQQPGTPTPHLGAANVRRQSLREATTGGRWLDAQAIAQASGVPLSAAAAFIERTLTRMGGLSKPLPRRGQGPIAQITTHYSPKYAAAAIEQLKQIKAEYEARQNQNSRKPK